MRRKLLFSLVLALILTIIPLNTAATVYATNLESTSQVLAITQEASSIDQEKPLGERNNAASLDNLLVTVIGLEVGDEATVTLLPGCASADSTPILENTVLSNSSDDISIDMSYTLEDGYYQLQIEAPDKYFREPKAWLFMVSDSELINPRGKSVVFKLIPPEKQDFQPFRYSGEDTNQVLGNSNPPPPSTPPKTMMEWMLSLSAPERQPIELDMTDSTGFHHFGYQSSLDGPGIWGRFEVVNPGVRHGATAETALDHIYAVEFGTGWIEIGWAEVSWEDDVRYMFEYDTNYDDWRLWDLPESPLEVALFNFDTNDTIWYALYVYDESWYTMAYEDVGFSEADYQYNAGEVYTDYGDHPSFPSAYTDRSSLYLNQWVNWDWQRWATTNEMTCDAYDIDTYTIYYRFDIFKE